jgi:ribosomal protein S18 acetylase RimI-like enzyme
MSPVDSRAVADLEPLLRYWRAQDDLFERVDVTPWGAVVSDARFPKVHEGNYARVEAQHRVSLADVESVLLPALERVRCDRVHVLVFHPEDTTEILTEASTRGEHLAWDLVMCFTGETGRADGPVEEIRTFDGAFWDTYDASGALFDVEDEAVLADYRGIERDVMVPSGRRWFAVLDGDRMVALSSVLVLEGVGFVDHVVTFPRARRRGYASALTRRALAEAHAAGAERSYLLAEPDGVAAALYEGIGFRPVTQIASWIGAIDRT